MLNINKITYLECSIGVSNLLLAARTCTKDSICMKKKVLQNSVFFSMIPETSVIK